MKLNDKTISNSKFCNSNSGNKKGCRAVNCVNGENYMRMYNVVSVLTFGSTIIKILLINGNLTEYN